MDYLCYFISMVMVPYCKRDPVFGQACDARRKREE